MQASRIRLKTIALDTAIWATLCRDKFEGKGKSAGKANRALASIYAYGFIPVISAHHLQELLQHENADVAFQRIRLLRSLPHIAIVNSTIELGWIGSIVDILAFEAMAQISTPDASFCEIAASVRERVIGFTTGVDAIVPHHDAWKFLRDWAISGKDRRREVASIAHARIGCDPSITFGELRKMNVRSKSEAIEFMRGFGNYVERQIVKFGDDRLSTATSAARNFANDVISDTEGILEGNKHPLDILIEHSGVDRNLITDDTTLAEFNELCIFRECLRISSKCPALERVHSIEEVKPEKCPSWVVRRALIRANLDKPRAKASDLADGFLSGLLPYVDVLSVDKRTRHNLDRFIAKHKDLATLNPHVAQFPNYEHLDSWLEKFT